MTILEYSKLYKKDNYTSNIPFMFNKEITEYDMKEGGFSITQEFKLLDDEKIQKLKKYSKEQRKKLLAIEQRDDPEYKEATKQGFMDARELFFIQNDIQDNDIISIKKDAIFTCKKCKKNKIGTYILFREKNTYTSYIRLDKRLELFYNPTKIDVKGISDEKLQYHEDYMLKFLKQFFYKMETTSDTEVLEFLKRFIDKYKRKELEEGYYRRFDANSNFEIMPDSEEINISYNFNHILLKLVQIPL